MAPVAGAQEAGQSSSSSSDLEVLMVGYQQGDFDAATALVHRLSPQLYRFFAVRFANGRDADDLLQGCDLRGHRDGWRGPVGVPWYLQSERPAARANLPRTGYFPGTGVHRMRRPNDPRKLAACNPRSFTRHRGSGAPRCLENLPYIALAHCGSSHQRGCGSSVGAELAPPPVSPIAARTL